MGLDVVIVDNHSLAVEGLKSLLKTTVCVKDIHVAQSGRELFELMDKHPFHLYIVDIDLADTDGFELIQTIKKRQPTAKVIVSTTHEEIWIANKLKHPHIDAVVFKPSASRYIQEAVETVAEGGTYCCPHFRELYRAKERISNTPDVPESMPTVRELDILKDIARGMNTHEISRHLFISENTVEWHRKDLMVKFGARNATDLVVKALAKGYLSIPLD